MNRVKQAVKRLLDRLFFEQARSRWAGSSPALKVAQQSLYLQYRQLLAQGVVIRPSETGLRIYSGTDDDGVLLFIFAAIGFKSRLCVDIGAADGVNSNCANLILNFGFSGLLLEGDEANVVAGRAFYERHPDTLLHPPVFRQAMITAENINGLIAGAGLAGEIDLLSVDIDGNDFWVWKAISQVSPRVVVIETHVEFGLRNIVVPYDPAYRYPGRHPDYHGASPVAMIELGRQKGYRLVATNRYGFNFIFVRNDERPDLLPTLTAEEAIAHPRNPERMARFEAIKDWEYTSA